ncbi:MAG: tRNA1(Val) (adenine(37)-N6)-methyltransferase [Clostridiales bacterium]|nr:tRNA1(Val) (adenine(37)-N6)-methyltransferase [Clostridiales bacterium]
MLRDGEHIDDLQIKGFKLIQNREKFCFGIDAVLLSNFVDIKNGERVVDLGTGTGVIPVLLAAKTCAEKIVGVEIQQDMVDMARRSVTLNGLKDRIDIIHGDIAKGAPGLELGIWDVVVTNPPYKKRGSGIINPDASKAIARHEIMCTLDDVIKAAAKLLRPRGRLYMIHRPERLMDIALGMRRERLEPKSIRLIHPKVDRPPNLLLVEGVLGGGRHLKWLPPLYVYDENGEYTKEVKAIYGRG